MNKSKIIIKYKSSIFDKMFECNSSKTSAWDFACSLECELEENCY